MGPSRTTGKRVHRRGMLRMLRVCALPAVVLAVLCSFGAAGAAAAAAGDVGQALASRPAASQAVMLAQDDGLQLIGPLSALRGQAAPDLDDLRQSRAARLAPLPEGRIFFRGARVPGPSSFRSRVTLVLSLPKALFRGQRLPVFRLRGHRWLPLAQPAVVGSDNTTAATTITKPGNYAVFLGKLWRTVRRDGCRLVRYFGRIPRTVLRSPQVIAEGKLDDPQLIAAVAAAGGRNEAWAKSTLRSYDTTGERTVRVIKLASALTLVRNWSQPSTVGRWFDPYEGVLYPPLRARVIFALPSNNTAADATLHRLKPGGVLIQGVCADMTWSPGYWPYATGGGEQYFGPNVSTYPPPAYDPQSIETVSELRWPADELDAVVW
jgi:hypothetical protein